MRLLRRLDIGVMKVLIVPSLLCVALLSTGCDSPEAGEQPGDAGKRTTEEGSSDPSQQFVRGAEVYVEYCAACHREDGTGIGKIYPPLKGSDYLEDKDQTIRSVVNGLDGELEVNGTTYNAMMPPLPPAYSDEDAAEVINYMMAKFAEGSWSTTTEEVSSVRE